MGEEGAGWEADFFDLDEMTSNLKMSDLAKDQGRVTPHTVDTGVSGVQAL